MTTPINIVGFGLASALGLDAQTCCAAARAGLSRAQQIELCEASEPVTVHAYPVIPTALKRPMRLAYGLAFAIEDLLANYSSLIEPENCVLLIALPDPKRDVSLESLFGDAEVYQDVMEAFEEHATTENAVVKKILDTARTLCPALKQFNIHSVECSEDAVFTQLSQVDALLNKDEVKQICLLTSDTLVDSDSVEWLTNTGRLKSEDQPNGLIPGEAASALLIDNEHTPVTTVQLLAQATESETYATANHSFASALTQIWRHLPVDPSADTSCTTLFNHTGEHYFAHEWAYLANNAAAESPQLNLTPQFPFIDFGDVGITYSSLGLIQTAIAKQRNYQTDEHTLILSSSTDALRTGMYVHHNELMRKTHD